MERRETAGSKFSLNTCVPSFFLSTSDLYLSIPRPDLPMYSLHQIPPFSFPSFLSIQFLTSFLLISSSIFFFLCSPSLPLSVPHQHCVQLPSPQQASAHPSGRSWAQSAHPGSASSATLPPFPQRPPAPGQTSAPGEGSPAEEWMEDWRMGKTSTNRKEPCRGKDKGLKTWTVQRA